jgi:hypothetical protein
VFQQGSGTEDRRSRKQAEATARAHQNEAGRAFALLHAVVREDGTQQRQVDAKPRQRQPGDGPEHKRRCQEHAAQLPRQRKADRAGRQGTFRAVRAITLEVHEVVVDHAARIGRDGSQRGHGHGGPRDFVDGYGHPREAMARGDGQKASRQRIAGDAQQVRRANQLEQVPS